MSHLASPPRPSSPVAQALARDRLGIGSVINFALTAAAPLMVVGGVVTTGWAVTGITGFPLAFLLVAALLALFCVGYVAMSRHITNSGAFYAYVAHGLGRAPGVAAAFVALLAYNLLTVGLFGAAGPVASALVTQWTGIRVPWWACALAVWGLVAALGALRVDINSRVLAVLLTLELGVVVVFDVVDLVHPAGGHVSLATLAPSSLFVPGVGAVLVTTITAFTGFEAAPVYSEESRHPGRTVPAATYLSLAVMAVVYSITAWAMSVTVGPDSVVAAARTQQTDLIFNVAAAHLGSTAIVDLGHLLFLTSIIAATLSFHNTTARYTFSLGREKVLPAIFGRTSASTGAPVVGSLAQSVLGLLVVLVYAVAGWDPLTRLFFWQGMTGGFGVLLLICATSLAVIGYFARHPHRESAFVRVIAPALSFFLLTWVGWLTLTNYANLLGVPATSPWRWILPSTFALAATAGLARAAQLYARQPHLYRAIGLGVHAASARAATPAPAPTAAPPQPSQFPWGGTR